MQPQQTFTPYGAPIRDSKWLPVQPPGQAIGRNRELASMHLALKARSAVYLAGPSGIGKTALAAILATAQIASNPGGVLWFNVVEDDFPMLVARVGRAYDVDTFTSSDTTKNATTARSLLEKQKPLIVLDGLIDLSAVREFARQCATGIPMIIVGETSASGPWTPIELAPLSPIDGQTLFRYYANLPAPADKDDIEGLTRFLDNFPMTLELAARLVVTDKVSPAELLVMLPSSTARDSQPIMMATVFNRLDRVSQGMLLVLAGIFTGSASAELLSTTSNVSVVEVVPIMRRLVGRGIARESMLYGQPIYTLQDVTLRYARRWLENYQRLKGIEEKALQSVIVYTDRHAKSDSSEHDKLSIEIDNIVLAAAYATNNGDGEALYKLIDALTKQAGSFVRDRHFEPEIAQLRKLTKLVDTNMSQDAPTMPLKPITESSLTVSGSPIQPPTQPNLMPPTILPRLSPVPSTTITPEPKTSSPEQSAVLTEPAIPVDATIANKVAPDTANTSNTSVTIKQNAAMNDTTSVQVINFNELEDTMPTPAFNHVVDDEERSSDTIRFSAITPPSMPTSGVGMSSTNTAPTPEPPANTLNSVMVQTSSPTVEESEPAPASSPSSPINEGVVKEDTEQPTPQSLPNLEKQIDDARKNGDEQREAALLQTIGQYYLDANDKKTAQNYFEQALAKYESLHNQDGILVTVDSLSTVSVQSDDVEKALVYTSRGVNLAQQVGDRSRLGRLQTRLGDIRLGLGDLPNAIDTYTQATETLRKTEDWGLIGLAMSKLGSAYLQSGKPQEAIQILEPAAAIFEREKRPDHKGRALGKIGQAYSQLQQWNKAADYHQQALNLARDQFDLSNESLQLTALAHIKEIKSDREGAVLHYRQALHVAYLVEDKQLQADTALKLGTLLMDDVRTLNQAVVLLHEADADAPSAEAKRLIHRAEQRLSRAGTGGVVVPPAEGTPREYASRAAVPEVK